MKVPILDIKVWVETDKILYEYYSKPVSSKSVVHNRSAMPLRSKRTVITQDILRIIMRCSPLLTWERVKVHLDEYMMRLQFSGYSEKFRVQVIRSAMTAYKKILSEVTNGKRPMYRRKQWKQNIRTKEKRERKENWYKQKKTTKENVFKSVLFVQPTRGSALKKKYEAVIRKSSCNVKVVERAGTSVKKQLQKSYPFKKKKCHDGCFVCLSNGEGNCRRSNVNYEIKCIREGCSFVYKGETARNAYCRGEEHLKGIENEKHDSVLYQHIVECHQSNFNEPPCHLYKMNVTNCHNTTLDRLVTEAVKIDKSTAPTLNRKTAFRANSVLKLRTIQHSQ